jgi:magnesium-transporting ATPase (P-type)
LGLYRGSNIENQEVLRCSPSRKNALDNQNKLRYNQKAVYSLFSMKCKLIAFFLIGFFSVVLTFLAPRVEVAIFVLSKLWEYNWPIMLAVGISLITFLCFVVFFPIWSKKQKIAKNKANETKLIDDSVGFIPDEDELDKIIEYYLERGGDENNLPDFESVRPSGLAGDIATRAALQQMNISIKKS